MRKLMCALLVVLVVSVASVAMASDHVPWGNSTTLSDHVPW